jgi:hypothetical protein
VGDRAVVGFQAKPNSPTIYLYSHWAGSEMDTLLASALDKAQGRWSDADYATRIVISQIIADDWKSQLGWGISVDTFAYPDYETIKVVEWSRGIVSTRATQSPEIEIASDTLSDFVSAKQKV